MHLTHRCLISYSKILLYYRCFLMAQGAVYTLFTPQLRVKHQDNKIIAHEISIFNGITALK